MSGGQSPPAAEGDGVALPAGLLAPTHARAWLAERAASIPAGLYQDAMLVVSELVTNAVRHGRPEIVLSLRVIAGGVRVAVADGGPGRPQLPAGVPDLDRPSGRGLVIVAATALDWGVDEQPGGGKIVWADLTE